MRLLGLRFGLNLSWMVQRASLSVWRLPGGGRYVKPFTAKAGSSHSVRIFGVASYKKKKSTTFFSENQTFAQSCWANEHSNGQHKRYLQCPPSQWNRHWQKIPGYQAHRTRSGTKPQWHPFHPWSFLEVAVLWHLKGLEEQRPLTSQMACIPMASLKTNARLMCTESSGDRMIIWFSKEVRLHSLVWTERVIYSILRQDHLRNEWHTVLNPAPSFV